METLMRRTIDQFISFKVSVKFKLHDQCLVMEFLSFITNSGQSNIYYSAPLERKEDKSRKHYFACLQIDLCLLFGNNIFRYPFYLSDIGKSACTLRFIDIGNCFVFCSHLDEVPCTCN